MSGRPESAAGPRSGRPENPTAILETDGQGTVTHLTKSGERVFTTVDGEVRGRTIEELERDGPLASGTTDRYAAALEALDGADASAESGTEAKATFSTAVEVPALAHPAEYRAVVEPREDGGYVWRVAEAGPSDDLGTILSGLQQATASLEAAETVRDIFAALEESVRLILGPTGVDVRRFAAEEAELIHVTSDDGAAPVDDRTVVGATESPYTDVWPNGEAAVATDGFGAGYAATAIASVGTTGILTIGRVGGSVSQTERDVLSVLGDAAGAYIGAVEYRADFNAQHADLDRYETLVESIPDPVYWTDASGRITFVNRAFESEFGVTFDDCRGRSIEAFTTEDSAARLSDRIKTLLEPDSETYTQVDVTGRKPDGREMELDASIGVVYHDGQYEGTVGVLRNVTERKREEEIATVMNRALRHNLRTSINNIIGYAELTEAGRGDTDEHMQVIREEGMWLMKLGDRLRAVRRSLASSSHSHLAMPVEELIEPLVQEYRTQFPDADLRTTYEEGLTVHGGAPLQVALDNVLENAILHNDSEEPSVRVRAGANETDGWIEITVSDDGPGIPERDVELVLGDTEITQLQHGTGIGLWITRWIVEIFDGDLEIDTGEDGTAVTIRLQPTDR